MPQANIAGLSTDLKTNVGNRYSVLAMIFFVGYCLIDIPTIYIVRRLGPALWIGTITTVWGIVTIGQGFVKTWGTLVLCRVLLGFLEGGLVPAAMYLLYNWYTRYEIQARIAGFYIIGNVSSGMAGLLAYGIEQMAGDQGLNGWRWIFIIVSPSLLSCFTRVFSDLFDTGRHRQHSRRNRLVFRDGRFPREGRRQKLYRSARFFDSQRSRHRAC